MTGKIDLIFGRRPFSHSSIFGYTEHERILRSLVTRWRHKAAFGGLL